MHTGLEISPDTHLTLMQSRSLSCFLQEHGVVLTQVASLPGGANMTERRILTLLGAVCFGNRIGRAALLFVFRQLSEGLFSVALITLPFGSAGLVTLGE